MTLNPSVEAAPSSGALGLGYAFVCFALRGPSATLSVLLHLEPWTSEGRSHAIRL